MLINKKPLIFALLFLSFGVVIEAWPRLVQSNEPATFYNSVIRSVNQNRLGQVWRLYPKPYQQEALSLIRRYSLAVDQRLYQRLSHTVQRMPAILKAKKHLVFQYMVRQKRGDSNRPPSKRFVRRFNQIYDGITEVVTQVAKSDLKHHRNLQQFNMTRFFNNHGGPILRAFQKIHPRVNKRMRALSKSRAVTVMNNGEKAKVRIRFANGKRRHVRLIKVHNQWMFKRFDRRWQRTSERLHRRLALYETRQGRASLNLMVSVSVVMLEGVVNRLEKAKTVDDVRHAFVMLQSIRMVTQK